MTHRKLTFKALAALGFFCFASACRAEVRQLRGRYDQAPELQFSINTGIPGQTINLAGELTMWENGWLPFTETAPGQYSLTIPQPWLHELVYKFVVNGQWIPDPGNPKMIADGNGGKNSVLDLDFTEDPLLDKDSSHGKWERKTMFKVDYDGTRRGIFLSMPPEKIRREALASHRRSVVIYFQDGGEYLSETGIENLFANLSARPELPVFYGVFLSPKDRDAEYGLTPTSDKYVDFMVHTVVPGAEAKLGLTITPMDRLLIGPSLGGAITLYTTFHNPEVFPLAASQSAAQEVTDPTLFDLIAKTPYGKPSHLFMEIGDYEPKDWIAYTRRAHEVAVANGISVEYREYPTIHDWISWRNLLSRIFLNFFDGTASRAGQRN